MNIPKEKVLEKLDWNSVVQQIYDMIGTDTAIINKYGIIMASKIAEFKAESLISPVIWEFITNKEQIKEELGSSDIQSVVIETNDHYLVFTFAKYIYLLSQVQKNVDLAQYIPSINRIIKTLDQSTEESLTIEVKHVALKENYEELLTHIKDNLQKERYPIFKHLVKYLAKK